MTKQLFGAAARLAANVGKAAASTASDLWNAVDDTMMVKVINQAAEKFEPVTVPVCCRPCGVGKNDYTIVADLSILEAAMDAGRLVRPRILVTAASKDLDRALLTDKLIEAFTPILVTHATRMESLRARREVHQEQERLKSSLSIMGGLFDFFINAAMLAMIGLGTLVGPMMWLLIAFGGIAVLSELPRLAFNLFKEAVGLPVFDQPEDSEIHQLKKDLERYRPLLQKMVEQTTIVEDAELAAVRHTFAAA